MKDLRNQTDGSDELLKTSVADSKSNFEEHLSNVDSECKKDEAEQLTTYGDFAFGRYRTPDPKLPYTVTVLNYPFDPLQIPEGVDADEYKQHLADSKVYLTISLTQPDVVMVELCLSRVAMLSTDEERFSKAAKDPSLDIDFSQAGLVSGIVNFLILSGIDNFTRKRDMVIGNEFRVAHKASKNVKHCQFVLGDCPLPITIRRVLHSPGIFQKINYLCHLIFSIVFHNPRQSEMYENKIDMERFLNDMNKEMARKFPILYRIIIEQRDQYMTHVLHTLLKETTEEKIKAANKVGVDSQPKVVSARLQTTNNNMQKELNSYITSGSRYKRHNNANNNNNDNDTTALLKVKYQPVNVVAVVGAGHVSGIVSNWNKHQDVQALLKTLLQLCHRFVRMWPASIWNLQIRKILIYHH